MLDGSLVSTGFALSFPLPKKSFATAPCCFASCLTEIVEDGFVVSFADSVGLGLAAADDLAGAETGGGGRRFGRRFTWGLIIVPYLG